VNGLVRRVEALEAHIVADELDELALASYDSFQQLGERIAKLADRYAATPAPAMELQSRAERIISAALGAADGAVGDEYARRFWRAMAAGLRAYEDGRAA
jgi:hypothetical protein